jgi:putative NIF3 family GTP cyclohydrolase 1 type 2
MRAIDIHHSLSNKANWIDKQKTVDRIIIGDPQKEINRTAVAWMATFDAVRFAVEKKYDLLVTHEPTFWEHQDEENGMHSSQTGREKKKFIENSGLVILRCHDTWDGFPDVGITSAWARFLGFTGKPASVHADGYQRRYDISPVPLDEFARSMAEKTAKIGEPAVQVVGKASQIVSKIGIGTGCACDIKIFMAMGCDLSIVCDDGTCYWRDLQFARDAGHAVIRVNHGTSEEAGMITLAKYITDTCPGVKADYLPHGSCFRLVGSV